MNNLNSVLVDGNVVADPDYRETSKGTPVCNFRLGSNRYYRVDTELQEEANFFDIETWAKSAERCRDGLSKGRNVRVVGRLKQDRWTDDQGGKHSRIKIVADHVDLGPLPKQKQGEEQIADATQANGEAKSAEAVIEKAAKSKEKQEVPF